MTENSEHTLVAREVDFPPIWLAAFAFAGAVVGLFLPIHVPYAVEAGGVLVALALLIMMIAVVQMLAARTTVIPGRDPQQMLTRGLFRLSRNPIYLADALLLTGLYIYWGAWVALPLVPAFMYLIFKRFILGEEDRLLRLFGEDYLDYKFQTRRWI